MGKPGTESLLEFREMFNRISKTGRQEAVSHLLSDSGSPRLQRKGDEVTESLHSQGAETESGAGADLHPSSLHLVGRNVSHRD